MHTLLAKMRLEQASTLEGVRDEARRLAEAGLLELPGVDERDLDCIAHFFATPEGQALAASAATVRREVPFTMKVPASLFVDSKDASAVGPGDTVVVQGVIDALVDEGDGLAILDYKTDSVGESALPARFAAYVLQVALYALAAERILRKPVKRASLAFLVPGRVMDVDWRAYLRSRGLLS